MRKPELKAASSVERAASAIGAMLANVWPVPGIDVPALSWALSSLVSIHATPVTRLV